MATRDFTTDMAAEIVAGRVRPALFVEGAFYDSGSPSEAYLRLWSGIGDIDWDGKTWTGAGQLLSISPIEESNEIKAVGFNVELSGLPQSVLSLALDNVRQGKPGRIWLGLLGREGYLSLPGSAGNYASTPDSAALGITGDMDVRVHLAMNDWTPTGASAMIGKWVSTGNELAWFFRVGTSGVLQFIFSPDGTAASLVVISSTVAPTVTDGGELWVRATFDSDNGAGGFDVTFYTSSDGLTWTQLGAVVTTATPRTIFDGTVPVEIGTINSGSATGSLAGKIYYAEIRDGIDGTVVASFNPSLDAHLGDKSFTSSETDEVWTINQSGSPRAEIAMNENHIIADPYLIRAGRMDYVNIVADGETTRITAQYEDRLVDLDRARERRYTDEDQQYEYPGDLGFEFVASLQDKQLIWGGPGAASSPVAQPVYVGDDWQSAPGFRDDG